MSQGDVPVTEERPVPPLFDAESTRKVVFALTRAAASSIASGIAIATGEPQDIAATLRIQREVYNAFTSLAYRDPSLPPINALAEEDPVTKVLSAINRFSAAAITAGVIGSHARPNNVGDAMRAFYEVMALMWPNESKPAEGAPAQRRSKQP